MLRNIWRSAYQKTLTPLLVRSEGLSVSAAVRKDEKYEVANHADVPIVDYEDPDHLPLPEYPFKPNEPIDIKKQRLIYQSRKRGMLENDLLLSTFVAKYLKDLNADLTNQYDRLINGVTNDWDIYYWATDLKPTPPEYDNEIMRMLKLHVANGQREKRLRQPNL